jgi:hypothetical protein
VDHLGGGDAGRLELAAEAELGQLAAACSESAAESPPIPAPATITFTPR